MAAHTLEETGGSVPHLNLYGQQHHRNPLKDKAQHYNQPTDSRWNQKPFYRSRTELQQARKQWKVPDKSYDVDGDGAVGQRDYFIGKSFDGNHNDILSSQEQQDVAKNLNQGWMDRFQWGHDRVGTKKPVTTRQVRGIILTSEEAAAIGETYPPHHNAHKGGSHITKTELALDRRAEAKNNHQKMMEKWCHSNPFFVQDRIPFPPENDHVDAAASHIRERAEADHQLARVRGGLLAYTTQVNPEREDKTIGDPGHSYVANPPFKSRTQLFETRKELHKEDCDRMRMQGEQNFVPHSVREGESGVACFDYRRPGPDPMTMTKLKTLRKQERREYDMANFAEAPKVYPRFCDQPHPWWAMNKPTPSPKVKLHKSVSEPVIKVTDAPSAFAEKVEVGPVVGPVQPLPNEVLEEPYPAPLYQTDDMYMGNQTKKRYTDVLIEQGLMRNQPRYFDNLRPIATNKNDYLHLDKFSSFDVIREGAYEMEMDKPMKSKLGIQMDQVPPGVPKSSHSASGTSSTGAPERASNVTGRSPGPRSIAAESGTSSVVGGHAGGSTVAQTPSPVRKTDRLPTREAPSFVSGSPSPARNGGLGGVRCGGFQRYDQQQRPEFHYLQERHRTRTDSTGAERSGKFGAAASVVQMAQALKSGRGARSRTQTSHSAHSS